MRKNVTSKANIDNLDFKLCSRLDFPSNLSVFPKANYLKMYEA